MKVLQRLLLLAPLLVGCPKRIEFGPEGELHDPGAVLKLVDGAEAAVVAVKGESKLAFQSPKVNGTVTLFVAVHRPALVHFESLDFFGRPLAVLVSDGKTFALFDAQAGKFYKGPASPANVSRFLPVVMPPEQLVDLLLGQAPRAEGPATLALDPDLGAYRIQLDQAQTLWVDPRYHRVIKSDVPGRYVAEFRDFEDHGSVVFPRQLAMVAQDTKLDLHYTDVAINESLDPSLYQLEQPAGVTAIEVDELGRPVGAAP